MLIRHFLHPPPWLLLLFASLCVFSMQNKSLTYDEPQHFRYGAQILLEQNSTRFDDSKMPSSAINALPRAAALWLQDLSGADQPNAFLYDARTGRYMTICIAVLLGLLVYRWSSVLFGQKAGVLSLCLYAFSPNIIAHARLITTDLYAAAGITLALYCFYRFLQRGGLRAGLLSALMLGLAQICKYTAVFLLPLFLLITLLFHASAIRSWLMGGDWRRLGQAALKTLLWIAVFAAVMMLVLNLAYLFDRSFTPLQDYRFRSSLFQHIQASAGILAQLPVPVPYPYLEGLDWVTYTDSHLGNNIYLLGEIKPGSEQFFGYYAVAYLFKEPIAAQLFALAAIVLLIRRHAPDRWRKEFVFLILPVAFFGFYFNFLFHTQIGIRFILVIFPLLYILCGSLWQKPLRPAWQITIIALLLFQAVSVLSYFPHYLPYFNELVWDRKQAYRILADSNINFGQDEYILEAYRQQHPEVIFQPSQPVSGTVAVDVNFVDDIFPTGNMGWLRDNFQPIDHIAHSHLIYEITPDQYQHIIQDQPQYFPAPTQHINERDYFVLNNWQASNLERLGNNRDALIHYRKMAAHVPSDPQPLRGLIRNYQVLGETQAAGRYQQALQRLISVEELYQQGFAANEVKNFTQAYDFFAAVTRQWPDYKLAQFYQGLMLQMQGRHAESIPYYRRFQDLYPAYYQNLFNLAFALMKTGDCGQAIALFRRTLQLKPDYPEIHNYLSECGRLSGAD